MEEETAGDSLVLKALFADSPQGLFVFDASRRVVRYNPSGRGVRGLSSGDVVGHSIEEFAPGFDAQEFDSLCGEVLTRGEPLRGHLLHGRSPSEPSRTLALEVSLFPVRSQGEGTRDLVVVAEDVTERQAAAARLAVLSEVHRSVGSTLDERTTARELVEALVPRFADAASVDLLDGTPGGPGPKGPLPPDTPLRRAASQGLPTGDEDGEPGDIRSSPHPAPHAQALHDMRARLVSVPDGTPGLDEGPDGGTTPLVESGVHSMIVAPLVARDHVLGLLTLHRRRPDPFEKADLDVARQAATATAAQLANARSFRREHTVASTLQRRLQPGTLPRLSAVETAHVYLPESAGGDWFDVIPLSGARVALVVGDVNGHGIEAAATMGQLRLSLRALALQDLETDELLTQLDEVAALLRESAPPQGDAPVATCAISVYDPVSRLCTTVRAGHPAPVLLDPDGSPLPLDVPEGPALGAGGGSAYAPATAELPAGSLIALYTNGLTAACGGDAGSRPHLERVLAPAERPLQELCDAAVHRMRPSRDDDAVLLLARTRALTHHQVSEWTLPADPSVVATARRLVDQQLTAWDLGEATFTTGLVISELVTNAIRYGEGPIRLRLIHDGDRLLSEVTDSNSTSPHLRQARDTDEGGRGLYIVMQLSSRWGVRHSREDKTIWSEQTL
ncbi:SpoIIE family protein phosphatase [Streptomyces sp. NPDC002458]|uniref:SpoIIE family protein phosphatase n=1 Tax=Streptomyces sp. NPDC002458 TaxID=3364644 RepID=UPI0036B183BE